MGKNNLIIVLGILLVILLGAVLYFYIQDKNSKLEIDRLIQDNENLTQKNANLNDKIKILDDKLDVLQKDVEKIYKSCPTGNVCTGHFPLISWNCNNVGDSAENDASHICFCDPSCKLNATEIKK